MNMLDDRSKLAVLLVCGFMAAGVGTGVPAQAQTTAAGFNVTVLLSSFNDTVTADQRCTHGSQRTGASLRIRCPAAVDVQAIARASASRTGQLQRMNAEPAQLLPGGDRLIGSATPVDLTISW